MVSKSKSAILTGLIYLFPTTSKAEIRDETRSLECSVGYTYHATNSPRIKTRIIESRLPFSIGYRLTPEIDLSIEGKVSMMRRTANNEDEDRQVTNEHQTFSIGPAFRFDLDLNQINIESRTIINSSDRSSIEASGRSNPSITSDTKILYDLNELEDGPITRLRYRITESADEFMGSIGFTKSFDRLSITASIVNLRDEIRESRLIYGILEFNYNRPGILEIYSAISGRERFGVEFRIDIPSDAFKFEIQGDFHRDIDFYSDKVILRHTELSGRLILPF